MREYMQRKQTTANQIESKASRQASAAEVLQAYKKKIVQMQAPDEDELLQGKFDTAQRQGIEEDELLQAKSEITQREEIATTASERVNNTGLPDNLKSGIENLSGYSMDDVRVHYNSDKPAQLQALAYAQGTDIHVAPGQEQHLPHEAWHVVQQKQGRVQPTMQLQGVNVNDNEGLEREADVMGSIYDKKNTNIDNIESHYSTKNVYQLRKLTKTKQKMIRKENLALSNLVTEFARNVSNDVMIDFPNLNILEKRNYIRQNFPRFGMREGDLVENAGLPHMEEVSTGLEQKFLTSVKLRFRKEDGTNFQEKGELDGLLLDRDRKVEKIISAKTNPAQVNPAQDKRLLKPFYEVRKKDATENINGYAYYLQSQFGGDLQFINQMNRHRIVGFNIEYHINGANPQTCDETYYRTNYPLAHGTVENTPVIGLIPRSNGRGNNIRIERTYDGLLDDFADMVVQKLREIN